MSFADIKQILFQSNLNFDSNITTDIHQLLQNSGIDKNEISATHIMAAAGIISEIKLVPTIKANGFTHYGINMQKVMSHLNGLSKEQFLERMSEILAKNAEAERKLSTKIKNLEISYRFFKKYRIAFQQLWKETGLANLVMNDMLSIFWVVYISIKNKNHQKYSDLQFQRLLIDALLKSVFQFWISNIHSQVVSKVIENNFYKSQSIDEQSSKKIFIQNQDKFMSLINNVYSKRYGQNNKINFIKFSKNAIQIARFLDDISNQFERHKDLYDIQNQIEDITFLELKKILAPKPFQKRTLENIEPINKYIDFPNSDSKLQNELKIQHDNLENLNSLNTLPNENNPPVLNNNKYMVAQHLSIMTPIRERRDIGGVTPCTNRIINLEWVSKCLDYLKQDESHELFKKIFRLSEKPVTFDDYQRQSKQRILSLIEQITPKCIRKDKRVKDIYAFFKYFVIKIFKNHSENESRKIFSQLNAFNSILSLSADLFNYAHSSLVASYRAECQFFSVSLLQLLKPINWIGKNIDKPSQMNDYLYSLEKRIVIKQIWEDQTGYNLIKSQQYYNQYNNIGYTDMIIWNRLQKHIFDRVTQLCKEVKILDQKLSKRIQQFIQVILKQKPHLLNKNKIDQLVICCITSFLTINEIYQKQTLQKVFKDYNRLDLSYNQNSSGLMAQGREMTLVQFYNDIFLPEIQDILSNKTQSDFILTPIRKNFSFQRKFKERFKQKPLQRFQQRINFDGHNMFETQGQFANAFKKKENGQFQGNQVRNYRQKCYFKLLSFKNNVMVDEGNEEQLRPSSEAEQSENLQGDSSKKDEDLS